MFVWRTYRPGRLQRALYFACVYVVWVLVLKDIHLRAFFLLTAEILSGDSEGSWTKTLLSLSLSLSLSNMLSVRSEEQRIRRRSTRAIVIRCFYWKNSKEKIVYRRFTKYSSCSVQIETKQSQEFHLDCCLFNAVKLPFIGLFYVVYCWILLYNHLFSIIDVWLVFYKTNILI